MMSLRIYKILTYILIPFAALFALNVLTGLLTALANPMLLIIVFIMACVPLYVFFTSKFLFTGIQKQKPLTKKIKDLIKVNAIASALFVVFMLLGAIGMMAYINNPSLINEAMQQMPPQQRDVLSQLNGQQITTFFEVMIAVISPLGIILLTHIILTFNLLKSNKHLFTE